MTPIIATQAMVHTLKVTLTGVRPAVWRRVEVPSAITLGQLSEVLAAVFGWSDQGLHEFDVRGVCYVSSDVRQARDDAWPLGRGSRDEDVIRLSSVATRPGEQFDYTYTYDIGDDWRHRVVVEKVDAAVPDRWYPACTAGAGLAPEEATGDRRCGRFDDVARARLNADLRHACAAVPGRDLPPPGAPGGEVDAVFEGLFPDLAEEGPGECPCGCGARTELGAPGPLPVHYPATVDMLADLATESALVRRAVALAHWVGQGRQLTARGLLRPAEARRVVDELGLADPVLPLPGLDALGLDDEVFGATTAGPRRVRSAKDLPALHPLWAAVVDAGLVEVRGTRACPGTGLAVWDGPAEPAQRVDSWARLLAAYLRARSETARLVVGHPFDPGGDILSASVPLFYVMGAREPVTVGMVALAFAGAGSDDDEPPPLWLIPSLVVAASEAAQDWVLAGVLSVVPPPVINPTPAHGVLGIVTAWGSVAAPGSSPASHSEPGGNELDGSVGQFRGALTELRRHLTLESADDAPLGDDDDVHDYARAHVDNVINALAAGPLLMVSPLGAHGLSRLLRAHGWWVPESGDCVDLAPGELLDRLLPYVPEDAVVEAGVWIAARGDQWESAVWEVAQSAAAAGPEGPGRRAALPAVFRAAGARVAPLLDAVRDDPWLGAVAAAAGEALGVNPGLSLGQRLWLAVDAASAVMDSHESLQELIEAWDFRDLLRAPGGVGVAVTLDHPHALDVLARVVPYIHDRDVARALRRALAGRDGGRRGSRTGYPVLRLVGGTGMQRRGEGST